MPESDSNSRMEYLENTPLRWRWGGVVALYSLIAIQLLGVPIDHWAVPVWVQDPATAHIMMFDTTAVVVAMVIIFPFVAAVGHYGGAVIYHMTYGYDEPTNKMALTAEDLGKRDE